MRELILLCGPSGSGKSTWAREFMESNINTVIISTDAIREELWGDAGDQRNPRKVFAEAYDRIEAALEEDKIVVFDATNLRREDRKRIIRRYTYLNPIFSCHAFLASFDECMERQEKRERQVPPEVVARQFNAFTLPDYSEGWHRLKFHKEFKW